MESNENEKTFNGMRNPLFERGETPPKGVSSPLSINKTDQRVNTASSDDTQAEVYDYDIDGDTIRGLEMKKIKSQIEKQRQRKEDPGLVLMNIIKKCRETAQKSSLPPLDNTIEKGDYFAPCPNRPGEQMGYLGGKNAILYQENKCDMVSIIDSQEEKKYPIKNLKRKI